MNEGFRFGSIGLLRLYGALAAGLLCCFLSSPVWSQPGAALMRPASVTVFNDRQIVVVHGIDCREAHKRDERVAFTGSVQLPSFMNQGTVFLSGWQARYLSEDHHFGELQITIHDITVSGGALQWKATGWIADESFDGLGDAYRICYAYTALTWDDKKIDARPFQDNGDCDGITRQCSGNMNFVETFDDETLLTLPSYLYDKFFISAKGAAILPRGFDFAFLPYGKTDHHLMQIAYNFDHLERFVAYDRGYGHLAKPPAAASASQVDSGYLGWQTTSILKDNDPQPYRFWEHVSAIAGDDIGLVQPPFAIVPDLPNTGVSLGCNGPVGGIRTENYVVEHVPYEYAVPILAGWELRAGCNDQDVLQLGVWLHDLEWVKVPTAGYGTLKYRVSSVLVDDSGSPAAHVVRHNVQILGIKGLVQLPDLVAFTAGTGPSPRCPKNSAGGLTVTVANQGYVDAPPSVTRVDFSATASFEIATPAIRAGSTATIDTPAIPGPCFVPNCTFHIWADWRKTIKEADENNNEYSSVCKG